MKKVISFSLLLTSLLAAGAQANDVLIYKISETSTYTDHYVDDPGGPAQTGYAQSTDKYTSQSYAIIEREPGGSGGTIEFINLSIDSYAGDIIDVQGNEGTSKKTFHFWNSASPLSHYFDSPQPLKGQATSLWNHQDGNFSASGPDSQYGYSSQLTGVATPLVLSKTKTVPGVPRAISETEVSFSGFSGEAGEDYPAYEGISSNVTSATWTLDTTLTKAANAAPVAATADLATRTGSNTYTGLLPAGTLENGVQQVHNLIYKSGYRLAVYGEEIGEIE